MKNTERLANFEIWLSTQDVRYSRATAARCALRVLPVSMIEDNSRSYYRTNLETFFLPCARAALVTIASANLPRSKAHQLQMPLTSAIRTVADLLPALHIKKSAYLATNSIRLSAMAAAGVTAADASRATATAVANLGDEKNTYAEAVAATFQDLKLLRTDVPASLASLPLCHTETLPSVILEGWEHFKSIPDTEGVWSFWKRWYQSLLDGRPLDWNLQLQVALLDDAVWEDGPTAVAREIARIEAKWELVREVAALKEQLAQAKQLAVLPSRLHNQPPEAIDDTSGLFQTDITLIWDTLDELEEELEKPEPSPSTLRKIAKWLKDKAATVAMYCGSVTDEWLRAGGKAFAIAAGSAGGTAAAAAVSLPDGMKRVSELVEKLVSLIGG